MAFVRLTDIETDSSGRELVPHRLPEHPIVFYYDELERYRQGYIREHWHPEVEFVAAEQPVTAYVQGEAVPLERGQGLWVNASRRHMFCCPAGSRRAVQRTLMFLPEYIAHRDSLLYGKYIAPLLRAEGPDYILLRGEVPWQREALSLLTQAFDTQEEGRPGFELRIHTLLGRIWLCLVENQPGGLDGERPQEARLRAMVHYIQSRYGQRITLADIAGAAHISKSECIRCFRQKLGTTPFRCLTDYRLETAARLLAASPEPVGSVAARCGFDDVSYFDRMFRRKYGVTPTQYRREGAGLPGE